jgi:hypothetical protein
MLRITADIYSGRPNPVAEIGDEREARAVLRELEGVSARRTDGDTSGGLGPRGFLIETLGDDVSTDPSAGPTVYLPMSALGSADRGAEVAERLLSLMGTGRAPADAPDASIVDADLRDHLLAQMVSGGVESVADQVAAPPAEQVGPADVTCMIELGVFNPAFWNDNATVRLNNNCYNYASNWRTNTFAQPGRGCGRMYTAITCAEVTRAALCDGMHLRFDCFPDTEKPRYLVALVVAPGPGFVDYHWFRKQSGEFWGHKPGGTAARNTDNSGALITNPETANRGPYTQFCGYFYGCDSQRKRIK